MKSTPFARFWPLLIWTALLPAEDAGNSFHNVRCTGQYPKHLQGICTNDRDAIYWSFTDRIVKTDCEGMILADVPADDHQGDPCFHDGKLYVAVNLGEFNQPQGKANSFIYVFDGTDLKLSAKHPVPEVVHGAGGIAGRDGKFIVVGGLPDDVRENYLYEYDGSFQFQKRYVLAGGHTHLGIQTAEFANGFWWFGCYGSPQIMLKTDDRFKLVGKWEFDCSLGITGTSAGTLFVARGRHAPGKACTGEILRVVEDRERGLRIAP